MGIVRRHSILNSLSTYFGVGLGYLNKTILFLQILDQPQYGLIELLISGMLVMGELSQLGLPRMVIRFFPFVADDPKRRGEFAFFVWLYALGGFTLFSLVMWALRPWLVGMYAANSPLFAENTGFVLVMALGYLSFKVLGTFARVNLHSTVVIFGWEVLLRLSHTLLLLVYLAAWIDFDTFLLLFVLAYFGPGLLIFISLWRRRAFDLRFSLSTLRWRILRVLFPYALMSSLSDLTNVLINRMDQLMLGWMAGEDRVAVYAVAFYLAQLLYIPSRSLNVILIPLLARHLKDKRWSEVLSIYRKTALNNLVVGALIFILIGFSLDSFFELVPQFADGKWVVLTLGSGIMFNMLTGEHRAIILNSRYYRFDALANVILVLVTFFTNYWLIPLYGVIGAALATASSLLLFNLAGLIFVWVKFGLQPYTWANLWVLGIVLVSTAVGLLLPTTGTPLLDIAWRSTIIAGVYGSATLALRVSPDINDAVRMLMRKITGR